MPSSSSAISEELAGRGVGLGTHPQLIAILRSAGIAFDETMGIPVPKVVCLDSAGRIDRRATLGAAP